MSTPKEDHDRDPGLPTWDDWDDAGRRIEEGEWPDAWPTGSVKPCNECGEMTFEGRDDLDHEIVFNGIPHIFHDLRGGRCRACGAQALEGYEMMRIEKRLGMDPTRFPPHTDYEAKVAKFGSDSLGTYWPKDIRRIMRIRAGQRVYICVVDKDAVLVRFL